MGPLSKTPMRLSGGKQKTSFYLCHNLASWLGIDSRKLYDVRHEEDIPPEFNSFGPFSVTITDANQVQITTSHDDFVHALLHGEKTQPEIPAIVRDKSQTIIVEIIV